MSIDNMIRIDHGNDFTLVDKKEFREKLEELFFKAEQKRFDLESLSFGSLKPSYFEKVNEMENIISYKNKPEFEQKNIYYEYILSTKNTKAFEIDYESMRD